ncbi:MAG: hypothetical protein RJB62_456 [Pseudomonadota bacterium]|jgi:hypothetical protein
MADLATDRKITQCDGNSARSYNREMRENMRQIVILSILAALFLSSPASAAWTGYENEEFGYAITFPGTPTEATGNYRSDLIPGAPAHYSLYEEGDGMFMVLVVDTGRLEDGAVLLGEFEYWLSHFGDIVVNTTVRLNVGMEYGRFLTIECHDDVVSEGPLQVERAKRLFQEAANFDCASGARITTNLFFTQGRLYAIIARQTGEEAKLSPAPVRFVNSLQWIAGNAEYGRSLIARSSLAERAAELNAAAAQPPAPPATPGN